jgi:fatty-acyl-CoA synthase
VPDERYGETVVALVVPAPAATIDVAALDDLCRQRLSGYKRPKRFFVVDDLQRSAAGKANYRLAREMAVRLASTAAT